MKEKTLKALVYGVSAFVALVILGLLVLVIFQIAQIKSLQKRKAEMQLKLNQLLEGQAYYENAIDYVSSDEFISDYARQALGLGKEGEESYN